MSQQFGSSQQTFDVTPAIEGIRTILVYYLGSDGILRRVNFGGTILI